jgi:hypothetical protein
VVENLSSLRSDEDQCHPDRNLSYFLPLPEIGGTYHMTDPVATKAKKDDNAYIPV